MRPRHQVEDVLEQQGLAAQQDVHLRPELAPARLGENFLVSSEQLEQDPLLHVLVLVYAGSDGPGQTLVDVRLLAEAGEEHWKKASAISVMRLEAMMTVPVMVISWSMSWGFSSLKLAVLSALYGLTWIWWGSSESGNLVK